jgi:hypothetical protein
MAILERSHDPDMRQALLYAQRAWIQPDQHNPVSTIREECVGESWSQAQSRTAGGRPRHQLSNNNARGSQAPGGRQQPPQGGHPRQANHRLPPEDLRQHINDDSQPGRNGTDGGQLPRRRAYPRRCPSKIPAYTKAKAEVRGFGVDPGHEAGLPRRLWWAVAWQDGRSTAEQRAQCGGVRQRGR